MVKNTPTWYSVERGKKFWNSPIPSATIDEANAKDIRVILGGGGCLFNKLYIRKDINAKVNHGMTMLQTSLMFSSLENQIFNERL